MALPPDLIAGELVLPLCNFHRLYGQRVPAEYFGVTTEGVSAYMCANCFQDYGVGLSNDLGYRLDEGISE